MRAIRVNAIAVVLSISLLPVLSAMLFGQSLPSFDAASIRPNASGPDVRFRPQPGGLGVTYTTLRIAVSWAYDMNFFAVVGGPDWADKDRFDIVARADGTPSRNDIHLMLRTLLNDRFKLRTHVESREMPIYALVVDRNDTGTPPQLRRSDIECAPSAAATRSPCTFSVNSRSVHARGMPVSALTEPFGGVTGRVVVDRTGFTGRFDYDVAWTPQALDVNAASFFTAVREQLGLRLEATKAPIDVLVIDGAEKPAPD